MAYELTYTLINNNNAYGVSGYTGEPSEVVIPSTYSGKPVAGIRSSAFRECTSLTSITIPNSVTSIGNYAFNGCTALLSIVIPDSVTSIGHNAFGGCDSLTSVTIPDSVSIIGDYAFAYCDKLTSGTISSGVESIGDRVFAYCPNLKSIILLSKIPISISSNSFSSLSESSKFYCFSSAIESYKTATNWNAHAAKFVADDLGLYFAMSASAQKKYFATKEEVKKLKAELSELRAAIET